MTDNMMHIGIDLVLQQLNSSILQKDQHEEKDYILYATTVELINAVLLEDENDVSRIIGSSDIKRYYNVLQKYIRSVELDIFDELGSGYVYGNLPSAVTLGAVTTGNLIDGVTYEVTTDGTANLTTFGGTSPPVLNDTFKCVMSNLEGTPVDIVTGEKYRIINAHGGDFTTVGAPNSNPGTVFTATSTSSLTAGTSTIVKPLERAPAAWLSTELKVIRNIGYLNYLSVKASVKHGDLIKSGSITKGQKYIVTVAGTTDLSSYGGQAVNDVNSIFACDTTGTPTWDGTTTVYKILDADARFVKANVNYEHRDHSFGSSQSSPIGLFADDKIRVYHDQKFTIYRLFLEYVTLPIEVDWNEDVDSDLPEGLHPFLVDLTGKKLAGFKGNPAYQSIAREVETRDKITK